MNDYLEEDFRLPYQTWKTDPSPQNSAALLQHLDPVIQKGITAYSSQTSPLVTSRARQLTLQGVRNYDSSRSRLQTHLLNQLQGLRRISRQQSEVVRMPERVLFDQQKLRRYEQQLTDQIGRPPTDAELADNTGFSLKRIAHVRRFAPGVPEGSFEEVAPGGMLGLGQQHDARQMWVQLVYDDLPPLDQQILEHTLGLHGRPVLSNAEIARRLGRSPGAISQRKVRIQQLLDREQDLSLFLE